MKRYMIPASLALIWALNGCGGSSSSDTTTTAVSSTTATLSGTVPGTLIEAFCVDGSYYSTTSQNNGTAEHPFSLTLPAGVECRIVMTMNEYDPANRVVTPIAFITGGTTGTTIVLENDLNIGHVPLPASPQGVDTNGDQVTDTPLHIEITSDGVQVTATAVLDSDGDGIVDPYDDVDHNGIVEAFEDDDGDGIQNFHDDDDGDHLPDYIEDKDHDGLPGYIDDDDDRDDTEYQTTDTTGTDTTVTDTDDGTTSDGTDTTTDDTYRDTDTDNDNDHETDDDNDNDR